MFNKDSPALKLYLLLFIMAISIVGMGVYGIIHLNKMNSNIRTIYEDRLFPIQQLTTIRYQYNIGLLLIEDGMKSKGLDFEKTRKGFEKAERIIDENWDAYLNSFQTDEELKLAEHAAILINNAKLSFNRLIVSIESNASDAEKNRIEQEVIRNVNLAIIKVNELVTLQMNVSSEVYNSNQIEFQNALRKFIVTILLSLLFVVPISYFLVRNVKKLFSELQETHFKIAESDRKYRSLIEQAAEAILIVNNDLTISELNNSACGLLGYTRDELKGMQIENLFEQEEFLVMMARIELLTDDTAILTEKKILRKDGSQFNAEFSIKVIEGQRFLAIARDITDRKNNEIELKNLSTRLQLATNSANIGIFDWDIQENVLVWDEKMYQIFGVSKHNFMVSYETWLQKLHIGDRGRVDNEVRKAVSDMTDYHTVFKIVKPDNLNCWIEAHANILRNEKGEATRMIGVNWDISKLKNVEEQQLLLNANLEERVAERTQQLEDANNELGSFSYSVSHDMRAPLRAVNGYAKILEEDYNEYLDDNAKQFIKLIKYNSKRMGLLIDDLLAFSRLARKDLSVSKINMNALVKSVIDSDFISEIENTELVITDLLPEVGDEGLIKTVWINLISNAIKYSRNVLNPRIEIGSSRKQNYIEYYIKDNGSGFDMQYYNKIFGVFQRLHANEEFDGNGIGLAIVQKVIHKHKGSVRAESNLNVGSVFYFTLPNIIF